jgi:tRNA(Ile)-lysidine synthase
MKRPQMANNLLSNIRKTIEEYRMIATGTGVVVGVSGGPDSTALLHVLNLLKGDLRFSITAAHLDHGLRPESGLDAQFVAEMAKRLGIEFELKSVDVRNLAKRLNISIEEAGRRARYDFLDEVRKNLGADILATGHHRDDEVETFFLRIFRGSSIKGLRGIPPVRGRIIRPLINCGRSEIIDFLEKEGIAYRIDETNFSTDTDRNFIRNQVMPLIRRRFPNFGMPLKRTMELIKLEDDFLEEETLKIYSAAVYDQAESLAVNISALRGVPGVLIARVFLRALQEFFGVEIRWRQAHVESISWLVRSNNPSSVLDFPEGIRLVKEYDRVLISRHKEIESSQPEITPISGPGKISMSKSGGTIELNVLPREQDLQIEINSPGKVFFDADLISFPLILRSPRPGDRFRPWGPGGTRKLKKVLIDLKIPRLKRQQIQLLLKDDEILWIPGIRRGSAAPITENTKSVLIAEFIN